MKPDDNPGKSFKTSNLKQKVCVARVALSTMENIILSKVSLPLDKGGAILIVYEAELKEMKPGAALI